MDPLAMGHIGHADAWNPGVCILAIDDERDDNLRTVLGEPSCKLRLRRNSWRDSGQHLGGRICIRNGYDAGHRRRFRFEEQTFSLQSIRVSRYRRKDMPADGIDFVSLSLGELSSERKVRHQLGR